MPAGLGHYLGEIADRTNYCRFLHWGLYLDQLGGESVQAFCCIDTSGSIDDDQMLDFLAELSGILASYPMLDCRLWYADADC